MTRIAIVKPDFGVTGGFELVLRRLEDELRTCGHEVTQRTVDARAAREDPYGMLLQPETLAAAPEFFRYAGLVEAFQRLDVSDADVVVSTQPPSFAVRHPRQLSLFYHHLRLYYDLSEAYVASGFVDDPTIHAEAEAAVRAVDDSAFADVKWFLTPSNEVRRRLAEFNGVERVGPFLAGMAFRDRPRAAAGKAEHALCVSRHEWPKRTELFVEAMKHLPDIPGNMVGAGGRLDWIRTIDARLSSGDLDAVDSGALWRNDGRVQTPEPPPRRSNVHLLGHVDDAELESLYANALCVVAPAYLEDYGLTAVEAMAYGKPVVVCRDGGGLADTVVDGENGFVVEPTGAAIADAVRRIRDDAALARRLSENALATSATFTWSRAMDQFRDGLDRVMAA